MFKELTDIGHCMAAMGCGRPTHNSMRDSPISLKMPAGRVMNALDPKFLCRPWKRPHTDGRWSRDHHSSMFIKSLYPFNARRTRFGYASVVILMIGQRQEGNHSTNCIAFNVPRDPGNSRTKKIQGGFSRSFSNWLVV